MCDEEQYEIIARKKYQHDEVARRYHASQTGKISLQKARHMIIAHQEIKLVTKAVTGLQVMPKRILDIPCGTGKLSGLFRERQLMAVGSDISREMLELIRENKVSAKGFQGLVRTDATVLPFPDDSFDVVICLRLLHRAPSSIRLKMLQEFSRVTSRYVILSAGINDGTQRARLWLRARIMKDVSIPFPVSFSTFTSEMATHNLKLVKTWSVLPLLSSEVVMVAEKQG